MSLYETYFRLISASVIVKSYTQDTNKSVICQGFSSLCNIIYVKERFRVILLHCKLITTLGNYFVYLHCHLMFIFVPMTGQMNLVIIIAILICHNIVIN